MKIFEKCSDYLLASSASANKSIVYLFLVLLAEVLEANYTLYYFFGIKFETIKFIKYILMKKLRFVSIIIVLLLFCPFIKQCAGVNKRVEGAKADNSNELKVYFTEESENVFELSYQINELFLKNKKEEIKYKKEEIALIFSMMFSSFLIISSIIGTIRIFKNQLLKTNLFYVLNISFVVLIVFSNMFVWLDRFGQIKIGFYLLLLSNFYMLYLLKQKKEQIL